VPQTNPFLSKAINLEKDNRMSSLKLCDHHGGYIWLFYRWDKLAIINNIKGLAFAVLHQLIRDKSNLA
jgi:hypothetical protein